MKTTSMRRWFAPAALIAALLMLAALIACGGSSSSSTTTSTNTIQTITLTPTTVSVGINQSTNFIATATDSNGNQVSNITYSWTSDAPTIAIVNNSGLATALSPGIAKITASVTVSSSTSSTGTNTINSAPSTLNVIPPVSKVTISPVSAQIAVGQTQQFTAKVTDVNGTPIAGVLVTWSDSNAAVVSIDANGLARGISPGGPVAIVAQAGGVQSSPAQLTVTQ